MKFLFILLSLCLLSSCTKTFKIDTEGMVQEITVKKDEFLGSEIITEATEEGPSFKTTQRCTHPGVCCKCGFTMSMKHECSCGMWRNCPGSQSVVLKPVKKTYRYHYKIKQKSQIQVLKSPLMASSYNETIFAGSCH